MSYTFMNNSMKYYVNKLNVLHVKVLIIKVFKL